MRFFLTAASYSDRIYSEAFKRVTELCIMFKINCVLFILYATFPNLQMCRNRHLLDCLISFYLIY